MAKLNPEDAVRKAYDAYNRHDLDALVAMLDPTFVEYTPAAPEPVKGREAFRRFQEPGLKAFPDLKFRIVNIMAKGDTVAAEVLGTGTFKAPFELGGRTIPPTGSRVELRWAEFDRVNSKGLVAEVRVFYDLAGLFRQLGIKA